MSAKTDQKEILAYLHQRLSENETRFCTIATIKKNTGLTGSNQYLFALTDDLENAGLVITRQAYQMSGGKLFQITAAGFDAIERDEMPKTFDSAAWTGRFELSEGQKEKIQKLLLDIRLVIATARLSNAKKANAMALIEAVEKLVETPDPFWPDIMRLLRSPTLQGIVGIAGFIYMIVEILNNALRQ